MDLCAEKNLLRNTAKKLYTIHQLTPRVLLVQGCCLSKGAVCPRVLSVQGCCLPLGRQDKSIGMGMSTKAANFVLMNTLCSNVPSFWK